ncbi:unnamed protein product [Ectocarpus sp. CCAP 1310/34]|nr:unnamed protein product [Ectocarpus sp. CCAP 1310/34]
MAEHRIASERLRTSRHRIRGILPIHGCRLRTDRGGTCQKHARPSRYRHGRIPGTGRCPRQARQAAH